MLFYTEREMSISYFPALWENLWQFLYHHFDFFSRVLTKAFAFGLILSFIYVPPSQPSTQITNIWKKELVSDVS